MVEQQLHAGIATAADGAKEGREAGGMPGIGIGLPLQQAADGMGLALEGGGHERGETFPRAVYVGAGGYEAVEGEEVAEGGGGENPGGRVGTGFAESVAGGGAPFAKGEEAHGGGVAEEGHFGE